MSTIQNEMAKCDLLASRYYNVEASGKERAAGDWLEQVRKTAKMINNESIKPIMDENRSKLSQSFQLCGCLCKLCRS